MQNIINNGYKYIEGKILYTIAIRYGVFVNNLSIINEVGYHYIINNKQHKNKKNNTFKPPSEKHSMILKIHSHNESSLS